MATKLDKQALRHKIQELDIDNETKSQLLSLVNEQKKYGLVWEDKPEEVEAQLQEQLPVLTEVKDRAIHSDAADAPNHILIEGDNLHALTALSYTHAGKIDVIYIDPPYNTGNKDFVYNDSFVDKEDGYRHSKWLSFMKKRLDLAHHLLSDKGVIFISIDDNEQAQLKLLCDEVFGMDNYISSFPWHSRQSLQNDTDMSINHEYLVCFAKHRRVKDRRLKPSNAKTWYNDDGFVFYPIKVDNDKYSNPDNDPRGPWKADPFDAPHIRPNLTYEIVNPVTGQQHLPPRGRHWRISPEKFSSALADNRILFGKNGTSRPQLKVFLNEQEQYGSVPNSWLESEKYGTATHGSKVLQNIFGGDKMFTSPKPLSLIIEFLKITSLPNKSITILDFFAGSGTTLHATMQLNAEDGGHRQCILVTNNENGICENVTYERNKRVINGYTTPKGEEVEGLKKNNLRYYKTDFVPSEQTNKNKRALVTAATDLLCIKNNVYVEQTAFAGKKLRKSDVRYFDDGKTRMLIIYNELAVPAIAELIRTIEIDYKILIYVFSNTRYAYADNFEEVADKVTPCALPAAIYDAYKKVIKPKKADVEVVPATENTESEDSQKEMDLFSATNDNEEGGKA